MSAAEPTWTCVAKCQVCGKVLNTAKGVPESEKVRVAISAPLVCLCPVPGHNTLNDCNIGVELEWSKDQVADPIGAPR